MVLESNTLDVLFVKDGQQGEDGKILYTWIKYAKDASGTGITDDPNGAVYIGISYNNESSTESNDPKQYAWTKIQGADGKKGEDAYTIFLENENISFATDENRNPLSEQAYTSGITIMKGAKPVTDFTIGNIAKTQGIAVAKTDTAIAISVVNGNPLPNDSGEIEVPFTVGGTVFKKILTWTCAKKGEQGDKGQKGDNAKNLSITPLSQYFKSTDGGKTFAPNTITIKPTIQGEISFGKWQYSIDGGVSFADVVTGQKGLTINNNVLTVSKDSSLYSNSVTMVTFRAVASDSNFYDTCSIAKIYDVSDIGDGRNLWITRNNITLQACEKDKYIYTTTGTSSVCIGADVSSVGTNTIALQTGTKYTISFVISSPSEVGYAQWYFCTALNGTAVKNYGGYAVKLVAGENIVSQTITVDTSCDAAGLVIYNLPTDCIIKDIQVEKGSSPSGWSPAPEDIQTAILSTKSEISDVSLKVDNNKQAIEQRVEKTTYERELTLVKGDISKANEGLNKWRYEIYPKSLFASEYQGKSTMDVFAKNTNLTPSQSVLINDTDLSIAWNYDNNYIGYALTFAKFSAAKSVAITFAHDDGAHIYLNGKLVGGSDAYSQTGESLTLGFVKGWNCIEVVVNEGASTEGFKLGTTLSALSECQLMNCYYGTPVARQSHITNQLVKNTTDIDGVSGSVQKVMSTVGGSGKIDEFVNNYSTWKNKVDNIETRVGKTYTTKSDFDGLEIGGRNLLTKDDCNMSKWQNLYPAHCKVTNNDYSNHIDYVPTSSEWEIIYKKISVTKGQKYILSFDYKVNKAYNYLSGQKYGVYLSTSVPANAAPANIITNGQYVVENTVTNTKRGIVTFTAPADTLYIVINGGCIDDRQTGLSFEFNKWKLEKGNKPTDWTPAPEDDEINGQNLVSNLPSNWEQGSFQDSKTNVGCDYDTNKASMTTRIRVKELIPVSGSITISNAYSNQSKKPIQHWITAFDVNKKWLGANYVSTAWSDFPRIVDMKDAKYIAVIVRYKDESTIAPSDISQICLKIERGTSATAFTLAPEDVNGKIVNVETIANQTAKKFDWIVKGGDSSSNFTLTDRVADLVAERINFKGLVKFSGLNTDAKNEIGKVAQSKVDGLGIGGRNLWKKTQAYDALNDSFWIDANNNTRIQTTAPYDTVNGFGVQRISSAWIDITQRVPIEKNTYYTLSAYIKWEDENNKSIIDFFDNYSPQSGTQVTSQVGTTEYKRVSMTFNSGDSTYSTCRFECATNTPYLIYGYKLEKGNKATDWTPAPEDYLPQARLVSNWTTNTTWIDGGKIYTGSITADKIAANAITADKIATDAIKSRNYISSGGTQGSFLNLSNGSFTSPNLSWDSNGNLIAKNANLRGYINATQGSIGGWNIGDTSLFTGITKSNVRIYDAVNADNAQNMYQKEQHSLILANTYINSFNSSLNSSDHYWHAQGVTINDGEFQVAETLYDPNLVNSDKDRVYYDRGLTRVFGGSITMSRDYSINSDSHSLYGGITFNGEELYIYTSSNILFSPHRTSIFTTEDTSKYNAIETIGDVVVNGKIKASNELQTTASQMRIISGSIGCMLRNDSADFYILRTNAGDPYGGWTNDRPFRINWATNDITCGHNLTANDLIANSWLYCSEVHSSGAVVIASDSESFYWAHGYQIARGTSWGGVCIGDDSQQLRLYGSSIWASHGISTSDENLKENFTSLDQYEDFYMNLNPIGFNYIGDYDGKKTHFGFGAHKTEDILESEGYDSDKFAVVTHRPLVQDDIEKRFGKDIEVDIETEYGISYTEFIALNTHMIQKTRKELTKVKQEKADLEARLQAIEAKLGL